MIDCLKKYNLKEIGKKIKEERKGHRWTQGKFAEKLDLSESSRQTIRSWEKGDSLPDLDRMLNMCELFNCELGYLLCEQEDKTRKVTDIRKATGLSESSITKLHGLKDSAVREVLDTLNFFIEHPNFEKILYATHIQGLKSNIPTAKISSETRMDIATHLSCNLNDVDDYISASRLKYIEERFNEIIAELQGKK